MVSKQFVGKIFINILQPVFVYVPKRSGIITLYSARRMRPFQYYRDGVLQNKGTKVKKGLPCYFTFKPAFNQI